MLALGITDGITGGAAVVHDGRVLAAVNEERLSRLKMAYGFPHLSIPEVLRLAGAGPQDLDIVAVATVDNYLHTEVKPFDGWFQRDKGFIRNAIFETASRYGALVERVPGLEDMYYGLRWPVFAARRRGIRSLLRDAFGIAAEVRFINHHLAHATSAYFTSGFSRATVVTMDGGGDGDSSHIYVARDGALRRIARTSAYNSLGNYYAYITHLCGFKAQKHEGKITGLAAHGSPAYRDLLNRMMTFSDGRVRNTGRVVFRGALRALGRRLPHGWTKKDLAASIQRLSEEIVCRYVSHHLAPEGEGNVALAGGIFANVRINQKVHECRGVERTFVHPGMTDCGLATGAALALCLESGSNPPMPSTGDGIRDVCWGPAYSDAEIRTALEEHALAYQRPECIEVEIARLLAEGYVVARFDGRLEYGPRALGNRSILYQPADRSVNSWLNERLRRTEFMPFAPATLIERADECYRNVAGARHTARFMTITFDCTDWMKRTCPGVVHLDGTARPQLVEREVSPGFHRIIREFEALTGVPSIINTSFNMHEEPIVCSPGDAIRAFQLGHLDFLAIGNYLVPSPRPLDRPLTPMRRGAGTPPSSSPP
jgi:carbamoyltransferase